jgi:hypothetical protein
MAKRNREQAVKEKAALKLQKKYAAAQARQAKAAEEMLGQRPAPRIEETGTEETGTEETERP